MMRLVAATLSAVRMLDGERPEVSLQNTIVLLTSDDDDVEGSLMAETHRVFPDAKGWEDHQAIWNEIEPGMVFGRYRLTWQVESTEKV